MTPGQENVEATLNRFAHFGVELGLERIEQLLNNLGNPHQQIPVLHVAGSNGKGSVCAYLSAVLTHAGYRVGRYTSPHLIDWCERICINEQPIAPTDLSQLLQRVIAAIEADRPSPTQFEVITAAAWLYFAECQVDIAVIEVGLGGRLDATNVCDRPLASIITSLSREHWQRLGPTLADIAREKAGILKPKCPAILADFPPDAEAVVRQRATDLDCPTYWMEPSRDLGDSWAEYTGAGVTPPGQSFSYPLKYLLPLPGAHQLANSALAITALQLLQSQGWAIDSTTIAEGIAKTRWFARLQWTTWQGRSLLIDGAHNPAGAIALRHYVDHSDKVRSPIQWVMGMLDNKDHADVLQALLRPGDRLYLVPVPDHASADLDMLTALALKICPDLVECRSCTTVLQGLQAAFQASEAESTKGTTVLCGSLYLIGDFFRTIQPPANA
ncbi:bifunctional folylpolyglutamate synthase/dihydrofolate synthase [Oscillatoria sp. FACHB-1407]|uniref:bifunctional folylpolyglutamate synthase/dihydrofolate synthase n=1 Tax=Oscillatoria sp. FACHB-1407 TaxID=2692847 RepID=UPI00168A1D61|nr:folylpolyglutamate synthase/dihydrofolate synthase family protein [Oscillatoria sp. FACHB-1407]MBD2462715.1 bifunctional folylpolyglutamate synthase/dihydrofolate synthase [Oscillatoria sp. FACHB-1407]